MRLTLRIFTAVAAISSAASTSAADEWVDIATTDYGTWAIKSGSLQFIKNKSDESVALVVGRILKADKSVDLEQWYVRGTDCGRGMGKLVALTIDGQYQYESDFVFKAGTAASAIASMICAAAEGVIKESEGKGI